MSNLFEQDMAAQTGAMGTSTENSMMMQPSSGTLEARAALMGLGPMLAAPNETITPEKFGASEATMKRASGGPIPGLPKVMANQVSTPQMTNDVMILNSALLLEYLESEFYARILAAETARPFLQGRAKFAAQTLARDEATHVDVVTEAIAKLGGTPIPKPQFQFPTNVFISSLGFLQLAVALEENGVGAYLGAAPMLKNKNVLNFAASIYGNEARHTAWIHFLLGTQFAPRPLEVPRTLAEASANAAPFIVGGLPTPAMA